MSTISQSSSGWQSSFLGFLPIVEAHAKFQFRRLPAEQRQDAVEEAIASACVSYQRLAARGRLGVVCPGTLANFAVSHVWNRRHIGGCQDSARDAHSSVAQGRHHFQTDSYNAIDHETGEWIWSAIEGRRTSIPDLAAFRIDFAHWLKTLTRRNRRIVNLLAIGERTSAVAERFGLSWGRVSQLRRKFERWWYTFQGEPTEAAA